MLHFFQVIVTGLVSRGTRDGGLFVEMAKLIAIADKVIKTHSHCSVHNCTLPSIYTRPRFQNQWIEDLVCFDQD